MKSAWMLNKIEVDTFFKSDDHYWNELTIAQAKKILKFQINIAVFKGHISLNLLKKMLNELEAKE